MAIFVIKPFYADMNNFLADIEKTNLQIKEKTDLKNNIQKLLDNVKQNQDKIIFSESVVPKSSLPEELFVIFEELAIRSGILLGNLEINDSAKTAKSSRPSPTGDKKEEAQLFSLNEIRIETKTSGTYDNLKSFLTAVQQSRRLLDVVGLGFQKTQNLDIYDFNITITAYYSK